MKNIKEYFNNLHTSKKLNNILDMMISSDYKVEERPKPQGAMETESVNKTRLYFFKILTGYETPDDLKIKKYKN